MNERGSGGRGGMAAAVVALALGGSGCVDRLVSDDVDRSALILPPGTEVPDAEANAEIAARIDANDGFDGDVVWALDGFWDGAPVTWWDFGEASPVPIPLYLLVRETDGVGTFEVRSRSFDPLPTHPPIFDKIPGNAGYSPWWEIVLVPVTDDYAGEVLASFEAVYEAEREGLVEAPIPVPKAINCPIVLEEARLERVPGGALEEPSVAYWRGREVYYFSFDTIDLAGVSVPVSATYELRREGGEPLSEQVRGVDMNDDGDDRDTNDVFADGPGDAAYSGMVTRVDVVVRADTPSIDSEEGAVITSIGDLFDQQAGQWVPDPEHVIAVYPDTVVYNRPIAPRAE